MTIAKDYASVGYCVSVAATEQAQYDPDDRGSSSDSDLERVELFGLDLVNADSVDDVLLELLDEQPVDDDYLPLVLTPNVDILVGLARNREKPEAELFRRARYCLPDGQPVVLVSQLLGRGLRQRLAGSDLFVALWPAIVDQEIPVVVVASSGKVADLLGMENPNAEFIVPPIIDPDNERQIADLALEILETCDRVRPKMLLVGLGHPKDARIIASVFDRWDSRLGSKPVAMGLGGSFSFYLGLTRRAPEFMQRNSLEWFYRFCQEPKRLFRRYFVEDLAFVPLVFQEWMKLRRRR